MIPDNEPVDIARLERAAYRTARAIGRQIEELLANTPGAAIEHAIERLASDLLKEKPLVALIAMNSAWVRSAYLNLLKRQKAEDRVRLKGRDLWLDRLTVNLASSKRKRPAP